MFLLKIVKSIYGEVPSKRSLKNFFYLIIKKFSRLESHLTSESVFNKLVGLQLNLVLKPLVKYLEF